MRITERQLRRLIREEVTALIESNTVGGLDETSTDEAIADHFAYLYLNSKLDDATLHAQFSAAVEKVNAYRDRTGELGVDENQIINYINDKTEMGVGENIVSGRGDLGLSRVEQAVQNFSRLHDHDERRYDQVVIILAVQNAIDGVTPVKDCEEFLPFCEDPLQKIINFRLTKDELQELKQAFQSRWKIHRSDTDLKKEVYDEKKKGVYGASAYADDVYDKWMQSFRSAGERQANRALAWRMNR